MTPAALIILKPRKIEVTERALDELNIPIIEIAGYNERQLANGAFQAALELVPADHYIVAADDVIIHPPALEAVRERLTDDSVVTGYCQFSHTDWRVNVTRRPLEGSIPKAGAYDFLSFHEMASGPATRRTWFAGMALTAMSAAMWRRYPFGCFLADGNTGFASDFHLSLRLQADDVLVSAVRDGFVYHWRHVQSHTNDSRDDPVLVGEIEPSIRVR